MAERRSREADRTGVDVQRQALPVVGARVVRHLHAVEHPLPGHLRIGDAGQQDRRREIVGHVGLQVEILGGAEDDHRGRILRHHIGVGSVFAAAARLLEHAQVVRRLDPVARRGDGPVLLTGIEQLVVADEIALAVEVDRQRIGLRVVDRFEQRHHGILARIEREIAARAAELPDAVGHGRIFAEDDVARRVGRRPRVVARLGVVGGDGGQTQPVEVDPLGAVVVQDQVLVVGVRARGGRVGRTAARIELLDENGSRTRIAELHLQRDVAAGQIDQLDRAVEDGRRIGFVEHGEAVVPRCDEEFGTSQGIGRGGVDVARIAVGEGHADPLAAKVSPLLGPDDRHRERAERIGIGVSLERRAGGRQRQKQECG